MANARGKTIDTTCLPLVGHTAMRGYIHRDYLAHCLRYSHVASHLQEQRRHLTAHVLDVGCGREAPLARLMFSMMMTHSTGSYTGVDYGKVEWPDSIPEDTKRFKAKFIGKSDFAKVSLPRSTYDVITCFEVLEHVEAAHAFEMLRRMRKLLARDGFAFVSTPCYDARVGAAKNHVNEMSFSAFKALLQLAEFEVAAVWGTFASQKDYKKDMTSGQREVFDALSSYYDSGVISCMFAPMFPSKSRNAIWRLRPGAGPRIGRAMAEAVAKKGEASSSRWVADLKKIMKHTYE